MNERQRSDSNPELRELALRLDYMRARSEYEVQKVRLAHALNVEGLLVETMRDLFSRNEIDLARHVAESYGQTVEEARGADSAVRVASANLGECRARISQAIKDRRAAESAMPIGPQT